MSTKIETTTAADVTQATVLRGAKGGEAVGAGGVYIVECIGADGQVKWADEFHNLILNEGLQDMNAKYFNGAGYTAAHFVGLIQGPAAGNTIAAVDSLASHAGWPETTAYTGSRKTLTMGSATDADPSVISNTASVASFAMNATVTVAGAFLATVSSGTAGVLFSAGNFTGGDKFVDSGDTLNVTYQFSLAAT
jgi:hypothetical protein